MMSSNRVSDPKNTIAFQGVAGAHSDLACQKCYPYMDTLSCNAFEDVFDAVSDGRAALGLIPIENSHAGRVAEIHNLLPATDLNIIGEYFHKVQQHLLGTEGSSLETIKSAYSHPQALMQCREGLRKLGITAEPYSDTASATASVAKWGDPTRSALSSDLAAELYGLKVLQRDLQDADSNRTLFVTIAKEPLDLDPSGDEKILTSMIFTTRNISAGLYKALGGFATNNVNLMKLESYIPDYTAGTVQFFITFEGHPGERKVQLALEELGFFTRKVQLLGVYPADMARYK